jgi:hypothetical protein
VVERGWDDALALAETMDDLTLCAYHSAPECPRALTPWIPVSISPPAAG